MSLDFMGKGRDTHPAVYILPDDGPDVEPDPAIPEAKKQPLNLPDACSIAPSIGITTETPWSPEEEELLVHTVAKHQWIYARHQRCSNSSVKQNGWREITAIVKPDSTEDAVKGKWNILRDRYRRIKNMARRSQSSDAEGHEARSRSRSRASTWYLYPLLDELLHAHTTHRSRTISSSVQKASIKGAAANSFDENSEGADGSEFDDASLANGSGGDVRTVGGDNSETTAGGRGDVTLASRNGEETTAGRDDDETPTGRNSDSTTTGLSGDFTLASGIRSATVADMRSSSVLAADRSGGVAIVPRSGGVNVSGRRLGVTVAGRSGRVIIVGRRRDAIVAASSISSSMAIASRGDGVAIAGSSGDVNTADRSGSVNSSGGSEDVATVGGSGDANRHGRSGIVSSSGRSDDVATAGRGGDVNTADRRDSVNSSGRSDDVASPGRSGDVTMADWSGSVTMDGRTGGMATIKSEIDSDGQTFSSDTHESLFPALDVDHLAADRVPSVDENNWEAPQPRVSSAQTRKRSPEYRARLAEERAPSRWQRKRARNGDGPTPWRQEVLNYIKGKEEDGFDHFGRQVASIMRRLPKKKSYVLQQEIIQLIMREDTE